MKRINRLAAFALASLVFLSSCGSGAEGKRVTEISAANMRLTRITGTVAVTDGSGNPMPSEENMRLYSGNALSTREDSRAGIALDESKSSTLGEESDADITQSGKALTLHLQKGELYFNVAAPLNKDESFSIATSNMTLGIRGTSGYVAAAGENETSVILVSGQAIITAPGGASHPIRAGQKITVETDGNGMRFTEESITKDVLPELLSEELAADPAALERAEKESLGTGEDPSGSGDTGDTGSDTSAMTDRREIIEYDSEGNRVSRTVYWTSFTQYGEAIHILNQFDPYDRMIRSRSDFSFGAWDETTYTYEPGSPVVTYDHNALSFIRTGPGSPTFAGETVTSQHIVYTMEDPMNRIMWISNGVDENHNDPGPYNMTVRIAEYDRIRTSDAEPIRTADFECKDAYVVTLY